MRDSWLKGLSVGLASTSAVTSCSACLIGSYSRVE